MLNHVSIGLIDLLPFGMWALPDLYQEKPQPIGRPVDDIEESKFDQGKNAGRRASNVGAVSRDVDR